MSTQIGIDGLQGISAVAGVTGAVRGIISPDIDVWDPIAGAEIVAEPVLESEGPVPSVLGRRGVQQVSHDVVEQAARQKGAVTGSTDVHGRFAIATREQAAGWRVFACFSEIHPAGSAKGAPLRKEVCFDLGVFAARKPIDAVIPEALYCALKKLADQWTVCGRLTECASGQAIAGAQVTARDVDVVQDDLLGTAPTNASGVYRIDYPGSAFRQGTILDIELFGGPDVYFSVSDSGGHVLFEEKPAAGRGPGRADRDCCARIDLCATVGAQGGGTTFSGAWVKVGNAFVIPDASVLNDFDAVGYMGAEHYALGGTTVLRGDVELRVGGRPVEYRFLVSSAATDNGAAPPADASFDRVVGEGAGAPLFASVAIGEMVRLSPLRIVSIDARASDLRPGGWLRVEDCIERVFSSTPGLTPADIPRFIWNPDGLMGLNTGALSTAPNVPAGSVAPGATVPAASHIPTERFGLRFQIRSVNPADASDVTPLPGDGITLNSVVVNNNAVYLAFAVQANGGVVTCDPATGTVTLAYTAYHPELGSVGLSVAPNVGAPALSSSPLSGNTNLAVFESENASVAIPAAPGLHKCGYIATLGATPRLHNGEVAFGYNQLQQAFYYEP